mgnify:CR=1 FL=1
MLVHEDFRGRIHVVSIEGIQIKFITTRAGFLRGGEIHPNNQYNTVLSGEVEFILKLNGIADIHRLKTQNGQITITAGTPHMSRSVTDSVMIEWYDGEYQSEYYPEYRKLVDGQMAEFREKLKL